MIEPPYPPARAAASRVYPHFARHITTANTARSQATAPLPDASTIEGIIDAAFWASLRREEGYTPRISLAYVSSEHVPLPLKFERPLPLTSHALTRLAPAVERPGIHLGVWHGGGNSFQLWGATRKLPPFAFVLEVVAPGLLVIKHGRGEESGKFVNVAVLQGDQIKVVDEQAAAAPDCPGLLTSLLGFSSHSSAGSVNALIELAVSMREHGRGGSLLVVPTDSQAWRESMVQPITYSLTPPFSALAEIMQQPEDKPQWQSALRRAVNGIAGLTAVDGATVITVTYEVLAFGAKIIRRDGWAQVARVIVTEPVEGDFANVTDPAQLGGTRHLSAAQFCHDQRDAISLVASQDGRFTVFAWSPCEEMVHAHRIEALLL